MSNRALPILSRLTAEQYAHALALLASHVDRSGGPDACWPWTGKSIAHGYAHVWLGHGAKGRVRVAAHRLAYEVANDGESPPSVDHRCHESSDCQLADDCPHRRCCNPRHLKAETVSANARRAKVGIYQERCRAGHLMDDENTYMHPDGSRRCRACAAALARSTRAATTRVNTPTRKYRPRGLSPRHLVDWALEGQDLGQCCFWPHGHVSSSGYQSIAVGGRPVYIHRLAYEVVHGPIPEGHVVDHVCHKPEECEGGTGCPHRACMNPEHLEAKTHAENTEPARMSRVKVDRCKRGHEFTPENTYRDKRGSRHCKTCQLERVLARYHANKGPDLRLRPEGKCRKGHNLGEWGFEQDGRIRCRKCVREARAVWRQRKRDAKTQAAPAPEGVPAAV